MNRTTRILFGKPDMSDLHQFTCMVCVGVIVLIIDRLLEMV